MGQEQWKVCLYTIQYLCKLPCSDYDHFTCDVSSGLFQWRGTVREQTLHTKPSSGLLKHIISQCYNRAVEDPDRLNQYEPFSAEVSNEILVPVFSG